MRHLRQAQRDDCQEVQNRPDRQKVGWKHWYQQDVMNGKPASVTLPTQVAPGDYLVRNGTIALHLAVALGPADFYPSFTQIRVGGSQTGTTNQTVSFPGAYNDDRSIYDPSVYSPATPSSVVPIDPCFARGYGCSTVRERLAVVSRGKLVPIVHDEEWQAVVHKWSWFWSAADRDGAIVFEPGLQTPEAVLSRRDLGIAQYKRHMSFMCAIRDVFYHS